jgi:hypothetical protein
MVGFLLEIERTMMSSMEKNAQIGELVTQRQSQKVTLEHLRLKGKKIAAAYTAFGHAPDRWFVNDTGPGEAFLVIPRGEERDLPQYLLNQVDLANHVREVKAAEQALAATNAQLASLGITD